MGHDVFHWPAGSRSFGRRGNVLRVNSIVVPVEIRVGTGAYCLKLPKELWRFYTTAGFTWNGFEERTRHWRPCTT